MRNRYFFAYIFVAALLLQGCDTAPGPDETDGRAPVVTDLDYSPRSILLDQLPPGSISDGMARFTITVNVTINDSDLDLQKIFVLFQSPDAASGTLENKEIDASGNGRYETELAVEVPTAAVGLYPLKVFASDANGRLSNQVVGTIEVDATGAPPVIESVEAPDRITRPPAGQPPIKVPLVAVVSDPDGLGNLLRVEVVVNGSVTLALCDDGGEGSCNAGFGSSGDEAAGDGRFTLTIQLDASNMAGENIFIFTAFDRTGLSSNSITRTIVVE